jgi:hypothetical protein
MKINSFFVFGLSCLFISGPGYSQDDNGNEKLNEVTVRGNHPRANGIWTQYEGINTALRGHEIITDVIEPNSQFYNWKGEPVNAHNLTNQNADNDDSIDNHYQNFLSEVWNFKPNTNAVSIWGDSAAIAKDSQAWGHSLVQGLTLKPL